MFAFHHWSGHYKSAWLMHQNNIGSSPRFHSLLPRSGATTDGAAHGYKGVATVFAYRNSGWSFLVIVVIPFLFWHFDMFLSVSQHDCLTILPWLKLRTMIQWFVTLECNWLNWQKPLEEAACFGRSQSFFLHFAPWPKRQSFNVFLRLNETRTVYHVDPCCKVCAIESSSQAMNVAIES